MKYKITIILAVIFTGIILFYTIYSAATMIVRRIINGPEVTILNYPTNPTDTTACQAVPGNKSQNTITDFYNDLSSIFK